MTTTHKGKVTISRMSSTTEASKIRFRFYDETSAQDFMDVEMSMENFASAITGQGMIPCEFAFEGVESVGMIRETLMHPVFIPDFNTLPEELQGTLTGADGDMHKSFNYGIQMQLEDLGPEWKCREIGLPPMRRMQKIEGGYECVCTFYRFVKPNPES